MKDATDKVVFILPSLAHGGAQKVFLDLYVFLKSNRHEVTLVCLDREGELLAKVEGDAEIKFLGDGNSPGWYERVQQMLWLRRWIKEQGVTAIYSTVTGMNLFVACASLFNHRLRVILREATPLENRRSKLLLLAMKILYRRADRLICTSQYVQQQMLDRGLAKAGVPVCIPNPVDEKYIRLAAQAEVDIEGAQESCKRLVAVGRLVYAKGFDVLISALAQLPSQQSIQLLIVGDGPQRAELETLARSLGLEDRVLFLGYKANPFPFMQRADLFVLSSRWEGYVNTLLEAMVLGIKIVATDCHSGPGELLKDELGMRLAIPGDVQSLAAAISEALAGDIAPDYSGLLRRHQIEAVAKQYLEQL